MTPATVEDILAHIERRFLELADPGYKKQLEWFFKEPIRSRGIRSADLNKIESECYRMVKPWPASDLDALCEALWLTGDHEKGVLICHLYSRFHKRLGAREFKMFEKWIDRHVTNWAHTDGVSSWLLAGSIENDPSLIAKLPDWTRSKNRWKRRASAVALLQQAKRGANTKVIFDIATRLHKDEDEMVRKGVGWLLKETYPKRPAETAAFVRSLPFSRLTIRYAAEKMSPRDKAIVMSRVPV